MNTQYFYKLPIGLGFCYPYELSFGLFDMTISNSINYL